MIGIFNRAHFPLCILFELVEMLQFSSGESEPTGMPDVNVSCKNIYEIPYQNG